MDEAMRRRLFSGEDPPEEPEPEPGPVGMRGLSDQLAAGYAGVRALQAGAWQAPANLDWSETEGDWSIEPTVEADRAASRLSLRTLAVAAGIFLRAALPRLYLIFFVTDPQNPGLGWYGDTFHHWQIAYLSKEIGFQEGFLRLWDFKGMEYFWGLVHPLALASLFALTGSVDIVIPRLLSLVAGSLSVVLLFVLAKRHFGPNVAVATALIAAFNPVAIFSDASGMQEPLGIMLMLAGLVLWPRNPITTGIFWALAGMTRAEYWVFGAGLVVAALFVERSGARKLGLAVGWGFLSLLHMKYLNDYTGNPIYPVYWNFLGNAAGAWMADIPLDNVKTAAQWGFRIVAALAAVAAWLVLQRRPKHSLLFLFGIGNFLFLAVLLGFSEYVRGFLPRFLVDRIFEFPYAFLGLVLSAGAFNRIQDGALRPAGRIAPWAAVAGVLVASQLAWPVIWHYFEPGVAVWEGEFKVASDVAEKYQGGVVSIPEDRPWLTYFLVNDFGLTANSIEGQMYDPFAYMTGDPFSNWAANRESIRDWLVDRDIQLLVFDLGNTEYIEMVNRERAWFQMLHSTLDGGMLIYRVTVDE